MPKKSYMGSTPTKGQAMPDQYVIKTYDVSNHKYYGRCQHTSNMMLNMSNGCTYTVLPVDESSCYTFIKGFIPFGRAVCELRKNGVVTSVSPVDEKFLSEMNMAIQREIKIDELNEIVVEKP